jgi:hypothetical protein
MPKSALAIATRKSSRNDLIPIPSDSTLFCLAPNSERFKTAVAKATRALQDQGVQRKVSKLGELHVDVQRIQTALEEQISSDPLVAKSIANVRKLRFEDISPLAERIKLTTLDKLRLQQHPGQSVMTNTLHEHISVIVQPYDWDWQRGNGQQYVHSRDGNIGVQGKSGAFPGGSGDRVEAGAGIGVVITSDVQAIAEVRPYITYTWEYTVGAYGAFSSGSARGGMDAAVFHDGALMQDIRYDQFFSDSRGTYGEDHDSSGGVVWADDVALSFMMDAGQDYAVPYGVWVDCDHSSGIGSAGGGGLVQAQVHFVVVHRWIAG